LTILISPLSFMYHSGTSYVKNCELHEYRCSDRPTLLEGVNEFLPHCLGFSFDFHKILCRECREKVYWSVWISWTSPQWISLLYYGRR